MLITQTHRFLFDFVHYAPLQECLSGCLFVCWTTTSPPPLLPFSSELLSYIRTNLPLTTVNLMVFIRVRQATIVFFFNVKRKQKEFLQLYDSVRF